MHWQTQSELFLKHHWGYTHFRPFQQETVASVLNQQDSLTLLPTGGGKSICYQLPILFYPQKTALIVSPLISLMHDQVAQARQRGFSAYALHSNLSHKERRHIYQAFRQGEVQLLYVSPERLNHDGFIQALQAEQRLAYIAIDEAHCISQWGHQFRPDYRLLGDLKQLFGHLSVHAFTATAPPTVKQDIINSLNLLQPNIFQASMFRANLRLTVEHRGTKKETLARVLRFIKQYPQQAGILYCTSRNAVEEWVEHLREAGIAAKGYHAGMSATMRERHMQAFMSGKLPIMVATVAFGMGVDRGDIRFVIHTSSPATLEAYLQEAGRAGRDGQPSECLLLWREADFTVWRKRLKDEASQNESTKASEKQLAQQLKKLHELQLFCESVQCRHHQLTAYFGQPLAVEYCPGCDYCDTTPHPHPESVATTLQLLSAVWRLGVEASLSSVYGLIKGDTALLPATLVEAAQAWPVFAVQPKATYRDTILYLEQLHSHGLMVLPHHDEQIALSDKPIQLSVQGMQVLKTAKHAPPTHIQLMEAKRAVHVAPTKVLL